MSVKVEQSVEFGIRSAVIMGVYLPGKLEYNKIEGKYYQFLKIKLLDEEYRNLKIIISKDNEECFLSKIASFFTGEELYEAGSFHSSIYQISIDGLPNQGKEFLIKTPAKVRAFFVNKELVAMGDFSGTNWLILEDDFFSQPLYDIEKLKTFFINKEREKLEKRREEVITFLKNVVNDINLKNMAKKVDATIEIVKNVDFIISSI